jgi:Fe-S cluster assembly protein SufD
VFSGTIIVRQDAQKTNAIQSNQTLLLTEDASIDTRPQLKIWADDVKCTHGATVGQLDTNALFYLRSRGINLEEARNMLIHAFASDIVSHVPDAALREQLEGWLQARLEENVVLTD